MGSDPHAAPPREPEVRPALPDARRLRRYGLKRWLDRFRRLAQAVHDRSIWQTAAFYLGVSFAVLEAVDLLIERVRLPDALFPLALALLVIGFPIILMTAWVNGAAAPLGPDGEAAPRRAERERVVPFLEPLAVGMGAGPIRRLLTWRNAIEGGILAFALWGVLAASGVLASSASTAAPGGVEPRSPLPPTSVAVLYFDDFSPEQDLGYMARGLTEALIHELAQVPTLHVISRNAVKPFRDPVIPIDSVARVLGAGSLVEGSVERSADGLSVTVQLIDGNDGTHIMSQRVERSGGDLLQLRQDVVEEAARLLRERLGQTIHLMERRSAASSPAAWALVQRAEELREDSRELWDGADSTRSLTALDEAAELLRRAAALDPDWPEPVILSGWIAADRADRHGKLYGEYGPDAARAALRHAGRALERWPDHPKALALRGQVRAQLWEQNADARAADTLRAAAESDLRRAVDLEPNLAIAWAALSRLLRQAGDFSAAKLAAEKAYRADAYLEEASLVLFNLCHISIELKEFEEARRWCEEGERRFPTSGLFMEPQILLLASDIGPAPDVDRAWDLFGRLLRSHDPEDRATLEPVYLMYVAAVLARAGDADSARAVIASARSRHHSNEPAIDYYEANARLRLGEPEHAVRLLTSYTRASPGSRDYLARDWWWEEIRDFPGFRSIVRPAPDSG